MYRAMIAVALLGLSSATASLHAQANQTSLCQGQAEDPNSIQAVLGDLQNRAAGLTSYQSKLDYVVRQPMLESQARRKGILYYAKFDDRSYLRIDFNTLQYDEEKEQKYREQYLFDGIWLTYVNYEGRSVQRQQMAEPNEPVDAFSLVSRRVPILGFSRIEDLENQFDIELVPTSEAEPSPFWHLRMKVKPDSVYKDDYVTIDFQIDRKQGLPTKVVAVTTEQDVHEILLIDARINRDVRRSVFDIGIPADFSVETVPLDKSGERR
jgi:outer membrane lipoprotein-sorting protein